LLDDALIVFVADHGEELLDHGSALHGYTLFEEQLRVPLLIRDPRIGARTVNAVSRQIDVLPTLLELLEIDTPAGLQGRSLVEMMLGGDDPAGSPPIFAEASLRAVKTVELRSYTRGNWKLIDPIVPEGPAQLFNLKEDPGETHDLAADRTEHATALHTEMVEFQNHLPLGARQTVPLSTEDKADLKALGYLPE
jgi:arylsulfatase A-like enzyme